MAGHPRRQLSPEQKREIIRQQLLETPEKSNRQIAGMLKVSHNTVNVIRKDMESTGQVDQLKKTIGKDGKARPRKALDDTGNNDEGRPCGIEGRQRGAEGKSSCTNLKPGQNGLVYARDKTSVDIPYC